MIEKMFIHVDVKDIVQLCYGKCWNFQLETTEARKFIESQRRQWRSFTRICTLLKVDLNILYHFLKTNRK